MVEPMQEYLLQFSKSVGSEWKKLCVFLGIKWSRIYQIHIDNKFDVRETVRSVLREWQQGFSSDLTAVKKELKYVHAAVTAKSRISWEDGDVNSDKFLYQVAEEIGADKWKELATVLKFSPGRIASLERDNSLCVSDAIMDMLVAWRSSFTDTSQCLQRLHSSLVKAECVDVAARVARNLRADPRLIIDPQEIEWLRGHDGRIVCVGAGGHAGVFRAQYLCQDIVVKLIHSGSPLPDNVKRRLSKEVQNMQYLHDRNTMDLLGLLVDDDSFKYGIAMTYMPNGSLLDLLNQYIVEWSIKTQIVCGICRGMAYLHQHSLAHCDLKSANILLDKNLECKVSDFGQAKFSDSTKTLSKQTTQGTITHMAPEAFDDTDCTPKLESDIWSFGIICYELGAEKERDSGLPNMRLPYPEGMTAERLSTKLLVKKESPVTDEQIKQKIADNCPHVYIQTMKNCCKINMQERTSFKELLMTYESEFKKYYKAHIQQDVHSFLRKVTKGQQSSGGNKSQSPSEYPYNTKIDKAPTRQRLDPLDSGASAIAEAQSESGYQTAFNYVTTGLSGFYTWLGTAPGQGIAPQPSDDTVPETAFSAYDQETSGASDLYAYCGSLAERVAALLLGRQSAMKYLQTRVLMLSRVCEVPGYVYQLQLVAGQLWALMTDHIVVLPKDGSVQHVHRPGFTGAHDMCVSGSGHVIIATKDSGLLQLSSDGQLLRCIDKGKYWSVTYNDEESVWAVKWQDSKLFIINYAISEEKCEELIKLQADQSERCPIYCAVIKNNLYLCSRHGHCIHEVDTSDGCTQAKHGKEGKETPGELWYPTTIYSDPGSHSLLLTDTHNQRLQVFQPAEQQWSIVHTTGAKLAHPTAAAFDNKGDIWFAGGLTTAQLYRCQTTLTS